MSFSLEYRWFKLWLKRKELQEISDQPQYIKDYDLSTLEDHYLFWDYLEIGKMNKENEICSSRKRQPDN